MPASVAPVLATPTLDPVLVQRAREAKDTGKLIDVTNADAVSRCRDLGSDLGHSSLEGLRGRARIRVALRRLARARGASHIQFFDYSSGADQTERGRFFDCTGDAVITSPPPVAPPTAAPPIAASEPVRLGATSVQIDLLPAGSIESEVQRQAASSAASTTVGLTAALEYFPSPVIALGLVPGLVFGIKPDGDMPSASMTQLDLRARVRFGELASDGLAPFGYLQLGGSWLFLPDDGETLSGPSAGLGFGLTYPIRDGAFLLFEIGYQASYQGGDDQSVVQLSTDLLHFGFGLGRYL